MPPVIVYFDGLCEPNPNGIACGGWSGAVTGRRLIGRGEGMTNNVAEYQAALCALRALYKTGERGAVLLRGDSQIVVKQFMGAYGCHSETLAPLLEQLQKAGTFFDGLVLEWVPREENEDADEQSRQAYVEVTGHQPPFRQRRPKP